MKYILERSYPYILAILATLAFQRVAEGVMENANFEDALGGLVTLDSIIIGFFGAIMPVVISMKNESKLVKYVFENDKKGLFSKYLKITIFSGLISAILSLSMYVRESFSHPNTKVYLYKGWIFFTVLFIATTYRSLSYMILLMFSKDDFDVDESVKAKRQKSQSETELEKKYK